MSDNRQMNPIDEILASTRDCLTEAHLAFERGQDAAWRIEEAFVRMRILLETAGLPEALKAVQEIEASARNKWDETVMDEDVGEPFLLWGGKLYRYINALEASFG